MIKRYVVAILGLLLFSMAVSIAWVSWRVGAFAFCFGTAFICWASIGDLK